MIRLTGSREFIIQKIINQIVFLVEDAFNPIDATDPIGYTNVLVSPYFLSQIMKKYEISFSVKEVLDYPTFPYNWKIDKASNCFELRKK